MPADLDTHKADATLSIALPAELVVKENLAPHKAAPTALFVHLDTTQLKVASEDFDVQEFAAQSIPLLADLNEQERSAQSRAAYASLVLQEGAAQTKFAPADVDAHEVAAHSETAPADLATPADLALQEGAAQR